LQIDRVRAFAAKGRIPMEKFLASFRVVAADSCAQNDVAVKYTAWSLALFAGTTLAGAQESGG